jgi:endonuclease-8
VPEGDAVWRTARRLEKALVGQVLTRTDFRVPAYATVDLAGATVVESLSRGKHLLTRIDEPPVSAGGSGRRWTLHTHLKMEGSWRVYARGERWSKPAHLARAVLDVGVRSAVGFQLGVVELLPREREDDVVGHLGPDLLGPDWDEQEAVRRLTADPDRPLGEALLDQRNLAGIGTIYRTELCFLTGYDPRTPVRAVADPLRMVRLAHRMLEQNRHLPQISTTGDKRRGKSLWIYGRRGERCPRCGTPVEFAELGEQPKARAAYWCPSCQPLRG